jgi:uncharacterized ferredoxin-like protein
MPIDFEEFKNKAVRDVAEQIALAARTAPKGRGRDNVLICVLTEEEKEQIAQKLVSLSKERNISRFKRDAGNVRKSSSIVLFGVKGSNARDLNCSGCGYTTCSDFSKAEKRARADFSGPNCIFPLLDLGIALGSVVKLAAEWGIDNRIMYTVGLAAKKLNLIDADVIMGLPLSVSGKNIYFDRPNV